jgi:hypothetical protein
VPGLQRECRAGHNYNETYRNNLCGNWWTA